MTLFLCGMMGSGKSTVGRLLARLLGARFVDLDEAVQRQEGRSVAELFAQGGELRFRRAESRALRSLRYGGPLVVALGGGSLIRASNRSFVRSRGTLIYLKAGVGLLWKRLRTSVRRGDRPLLKGGKAGLSALLRQRRKHYESADVAVSASGSPAQVARRILERCVC